MPLLLRSDNQRVDAGRLQSCGSLHLLGRAARETLDVALARFARTTATGRVELKMHFSLDFHREQLYI